MLKTIFFCATLANSSVLDASISGAINFSFLEFILFVILFGIIIHFFKDHFIIKDNNKDKK